jgi:hypothetical protein
MKAKRFNIGRCSPKMTPPLAQEWLAEVYPDSPLAGIVKIPDLRPLKETYADLEFQSSHYGMAKRLMNQGMPPEKLAGRKPLRISSEPAIGNIIDNGK